MCVVYIHNTHVCCVYTQHTCALCIYTKHVCVVYIHNTHVCCVYTCVLRIIWAFLFCTCVEKYGKRKSRTTFQDRCCIMTESLSCFSSSQDLFVMRVVVIAVWSLWCIPSPHRVANRCRRTHGALNSLSDIQMYV